MMINIQENKSYFDGDGPVIVRKISSMSQEEQARIARTFQRAAEKEERERNFRNLYKQYD